MATIKKIYKSTKFKALADQAIFSGNSFLVTILLARLVAPELFGLFAGWVLGIYLAVSLVSSLVIQPYQVMLSKVDEQRKYQFFVTVLQLSCVLVLLLVTQGIFKLTPFLHDYTQYKEALLLYAFGFMLHDFFRKSLLAQKQISQIVILDILLALMQSGMLLIASFTSWSFIVLLQLLALSYIPALVFALATSFKSWKFSINWKKYIQLHYQQGKWLFLSAMVQWWSGNLFVVASGMYLGVAALGAFRLVQSLFGVLNVLFQTFENYALPQTARLMTQSRITAQQYLKRLSVQSLTLFASVLVTVFLLSDYIIVWAGGDQYATYGFLVKGMSVLYLIIFIGYPVRLAIRALVLNKHFFVGYILSLVFSLISFRFMLTHFQLVGALIGLIASQLILISFWQFILVKNKFLLWR
ncbi:hypothetical protein GCM10011506_36860 [Marivirga lumbricoides]|uniref:Polysaccharide biosynthesis protein C-terminal domain-containing protein n=1 Tax=Marivirga lumbricoides TaxID=1046115 RepID=A0ABQ1MZQ5_9BACT|nr:hypothetical protein GCM10011506_36860 [Marivirga lumbricoides]